MTAPSWSYPEAASRRDLRLDLLRGLCVVAMVADHLGGESWLYALTGANHSYLSAAEGFIFISGLVLGQVYRGRIEQLGLARAMLLALRRVRTLYLATVGMTLIFSGLRLYTDFALWVPRGVPAGDSLPDLILSSITLHHTYHGTDILAMYVFCLVAAVGGLAMLSNGRWRWVLAASWLVWLAYQLMPEKMLLPWYIRNSENFPLAAWQVLFMTGLVIGFHRKRLAVWFERRPRARLALVGVAIVLSIVAVWSFHVFGESTMPDLFAKVPLRPARLIGFGAAAVLAYALATSAWVPLRKAIGWLLLPLGQHALYSYVVHFFVMVLMINMLAGGAWPELGWLSPVLIGTTLQLGLVFAVWSMVRRNILFGFVPN